MSPLTPPPLPAPCLCIAGPTASGKTAAALAIAQACRGHRPVEIISVDSALVFKGMDIGTAKPSASELELVPHHLINVLDPSEAYSAARFVEDVQQLVPAIHARGALPLLVGGTMMYFKALFDGLDPLPPSTPASRAKWQALLQQEGNAGLHARLQQVDPVSAQRLAPGDTQRVMRALEVHDLSGQPLSALQTRPERATPPHLPMLSLEPVNRAWLHARIDARFEQMLQDGLIQEVAALRQRPDLHIDLTAMRCVGYRQTWEALDAGLPPATRAGAADQHGEPPPDPRYLSLLDQGRAATRQLAKRQLTWLRSMPHRQVLHPDETDVCAGAIAWAEAQLQAPQR